MATSRSFEAVKVLESHLENEMHAMRKEDLCGLEDAMYAAVVRVRRQRNALSPLNRLPEEILTSIFLHVRGPRKKNVDYDGHVTEYPPDVRSLIITTRLCHRLRKIALSYPSLWTIIPAGWNPRLALEFAARSAPLPLRVFGHSSWSSWSPPALFRNATYRSRIQEIYVLQTLYEDMDATLMGTVARNLVYLNIAPKNKGDRKQGRIDARPYFGGKSPVALRALAVSLYAGVLPVDRFPALAHLRLCGEDVRPVRLRELLRVLSGTPLLETLYLVEVALVKGRDWESSEDGPPPTVHLNRLRVLSLDNPAFDAAFAALGQLRFSPDAMVQLHRLEVKSEKVLESFSVPDVGDLTTVEILDTFDNLHFRIIGTRGAFWVQLKRDYESDVRVLHKVVPNFLASVRARLLTADTLRVALPGTSSNQMTEVLNSIVPHASAFMPVLSTLVVASPNNCTRDLPPTLQKALLPTENSPSIPCPALETLNIQVDFCISGYEPLAEMLAERARLGHPIRNLSVSIGRDHDERYECICCSGVAEHVEMAETLGEMLWDPQTFWRAQNEYWKMYPDEDHIAWLWGLPPISW